MTNIVIKRYEVRGNGNFSYIAGEIWARSEDFAIRCFTEMAGLRGEGKDLFNSTVSIKMIANSPEDWAERREKNKGKN
ncbi:MAG: hypothetical protein PHW31_01085 [Candidatus Pacebacteria bacterium]|nr:hypothetical protein [Candidatus Paceibacterota bacterium]